MVMAILGKLGSFRNVMIFPMISGQQRSGSMTLISLANKCQQKSKNAFSIKLHFQNIK
jgi:hypothetical protein